MSNAFGLNKISLNKILLFISAYSPLFIIISIKTFNYKVSIELPLINNAYPIPLVSILFIVFFLLMIYYSNYLINSVKTTSQKHFKIEQVDEKTDIILSYLIPYSISLISLGTLEEVISTIFIFIFIFLIYTHSEIIYINPIFMLFGYKFYHVYTKKNYVLMLSKKDLYRDIGETIIVKQLSTRLYVVVGD